MTEQSLVVPRDLPAGCPIGECPRWPTMQWLPHEIVDLLAARITALEDDGLSSNRVELICALIFHCDPSDPGLSSDLRAYKAHFRPLRPHRVRLRGVPVVIRMPSPITHRLDGLVRSVSRTSQRTYRHELLGTLIQRTENELAQLEEKCLQYRRSTAGEAAVRGEPKRWVLSQRKPRPGARSF